MQKLTKNGMYPPTNAEANQEWNVSIDSTNKCRSWPRLFKKSSPLTPQFLLVLILHLLCTSLLRIRKWWNIQHESRWVDQRWGEHYRRHGLQFSHQSLKSALVASRGLKEKGREKLNKIIERDMWMCFREGEHWLKFALLTCPDKNSLLIALTKQSSGNLDGRWNGSKIIFLDWL